MLSCALAGASFGCSAGTTAGGRGGQPPVVAADGGSAGTIAALPDAGGAGSGSAASGSPAAGSGSEPDGSSACASISITSKRDVVPGNVLVVFDQSLTMGDLWNEPDGTSAPKYAAAGKALLDAITPIVDQVQLGAIFLPTTAATGLDICTAAVAPITMAPPQVAIQAGADFVTAWNQHFAPPWTTLLGTPLNKGLHEADVATMAPTLTGKTVVVIFTDGQWTCEDGSEMTTVAAMFTRGIKTYVVGLPGASGVAGLDGLAQAGGTAAAGCSSNCFLLPSDTAALQAQLADIATKTVGFDSCTFSIQGKIVNKDQACKSGEVKLDQMSIACDAKNGFSVDDETHISLQGDACKQLMASGGDLDAKFPCDVVIPD